MEFLERDIEDALIKELKLSNDFIYIGRQVQLPLGRLDVLSFHIDAGIVVFEIKRGNIKPQDVVQLLGYLKQVDFQMFSLLCSADLQSEILHTNPESLGIIIGKSINNRLIKRFSKVGNISFKLYKKSEDGFEFFPIQKDFSWVDEDMFSDEIRKATKLGLEHKIRQMRDVEVSKIKFMGDRSFTHVAVKESPSYKHPPRDNEDFRFEVQSFISNRKSDEIWNRNKGLIT